MMATGPRAWVEQRARRYWPQIAFVLLLQAACAGLGSLQPFFLQRVVSLVISNPNAFPVDEGLRILGLLLLVFVSAALLQAIGGYVASAFSSDLLRELQLDFFAKISRLPLQTMQKQPAGELFTRFSADTSQAQRFMASFVPTVAREGLTAVVVTIVLLSTCPLVLTMVALAVVAVTGFLTARLHSVMHRFAQLQRGQYGSINTLLDETIQGIDTLKTLASDERRSLRFEVLTGDFRDVSVRAGKVGAVLSSGLDLLSKLGGLLLIAIAYLLLTRGSLATDSFLLFFFYASLLQGTVSSLVFALATFQPQLVGLRNVAKFLDEPVEDEDPAEFREPVPTQAIAIRVAGLTFGYPGGPLLFRDAEMLVPATGITLVHGPSGSGKSTLINLLLRFHTPHGGTILLGDVPVDRIARAALRRTIGVVLQDHFVFGESLRENVRIAEPGATDERIIDALRRAHLDGLMQRLPGGLDGILDPRGKGLSGGERQRISIARALLRDSPIMVLDEPWSSLDEDARRVLAIVLNECRLRKTILIMSHEDIPSLKVDRVYRVVTGTGRLVPEDREGGAAPL